MCCDPACLLGFRVARYYTILVPTPPYAAPYPPGNSRVPTPFCLQHFLAVVTTVGVIAFAMCSTAVGAALIFAGTGSMVLAAVVLLVSSPDKGRGGFIQGVLPAIAIVLLAVHLAR